jgi:hypothetical protein
MPARPDRGTGTDRTGRAPVCGQIITTGNGTHAHEGEAHLS